VSALTFRERPAEGEPLALLILHHGRGTTEQDLLPLADALDPQRQLHVAAPRAPLQLAGSPGYHWYLVPRVGHPDSKTFHDAYRELAGLHDQLWERTGLAPAQTVLGGFSMGTVMSYALGLGPDRPAPAGILAFSGFIPTVEGWEPELSEREQARVFIAHGRRDPVIDISFARHAMELLQAGGLAVDYRESEAGHNIDPADVPRAIDWLSKLRPRETP
jgi:phospholipase/carboxylesterase